MRFGTENGGDVIDERDLSDCDIHSGNLHVRYLIRAGWYNLTTMIDDDAMIIAVLYRVPR